MPLETILQIILLSLILFIPLMLYRTKPSWWVVWGCVAYSLSYFIANIWQIAFWLIEPWPPEIAEAIQSIEAPGSPLGFALRLFQAGTLLLVAMYAGTVFFALRDRGLQTRLVWLVLWIAESFAVLEYLECKVFTDPFGSGDLYLAQVWGVEVSRYACGRAFGYLTPYAAPIITSLYLIWVNIKARGDGLPLL